MRGLLALAYIVKKYSSFSAIGSLVESHPYPKDHLIM